MKAPGAALRNSSAVCGICTQPWSAAAQSSTAQAWIGFIVFSLCPASTTESLPAQAQQFQEILGLRLVARHALGKREPGLRAARPQVCLGTEPRGVVERSRADHRQPGSMRRLGPHPDVADGADLARPRPAIG